MLNFKIEPSHVNAQARLICQVLNEGGHQAYIVGGCVRDLLLNVNPKDWDICTGASPEQVIELFDKTIPTGLKHGTITVVMGQGTENHFEVTTFRVEGEYLDGRRPEEVRFVKNVKEDLSRRDLTINAIAYDPINEKLIDPFNGVQDLKNGIIRAVGNAADRFAEDGLRIMRVARFAARFGYPVEECTLQGMTSSIDTLSKVSKERIRDELCKTLMTKDPVLGLNILKQTGALTIACPTLLKEKSFFNNHNKYTGDLETRVAFLYSNCKRIEWINQDLLDLKFSSKEIKKIIFLSALLDKCPLFKPINERDRVAAYKEFIILIKNQYQESWAEVLEQFILLVEPMCEDARRYFKDNEKVIIYSRKEMNINGNDLLSIGVVPGPKMKELLDECHEEITNNPEHNVKDYLIKFVSNK